MNNSASPPVIAVTGKKNSGKTTVVESLIRHMSNKGWKVGTIKHHHFGDFEPDTPGKDSYRHFNAGAAGVVLASPNKLAYFERTEKETPSVEALMRFFPHDTSLILLEGFHQSAYPRIEVSRKEMSTTLLSDDKTLLVAVVSDYSPAIPVKNFSFADIEELADYLHTYLQGRPE